MNNLRLLLLPLAFVYGAAVWLRNIFFDLGLLPSRSFSIPVISVGNLSTGGTGKTPHVEYLVGMLDGHYKVAVLSRGYKRKTRGFLVANQNSTVNDLGDEPLQMHRKFPKILVAVDEKRRRGIRNILTLYPDINLIILDDAFQHRYVKPGLNLLLTEYYKPFFRNYLLPVGSLREPKSGARRADALIVTKTPEVFSPLDRQFFLKKLSSCQLNNIFFSYLNYGVMKPLTPNTPEEEPENIKSIFLLTGIANSVALEEELKTRCQELFMHKYPDHHQFVPTDINKLVKHFNSTISHCKIVLTTEKDAMRLQDEKLQNLLADIPVYYLPVQTGFHTKDMEKFHQMIMTFLRQFSENRL